MIDRKWRTEGIYGKKVFAFFSDLIEKKPVQITECLLDPEKYKKKYKLKKRR